MVWLSQNPNAIHILENNLDKVKWDWLSQNPNAIHLIYKLDTIHMRNKCKSFTEELAKYVFHPVRLSKMAQLYGFDCIEDYTEFI